MSPSPEHVKSLAGRIFTTVLAFSLGILLAFSAVMVSIFYYSYEHDAEQALVQEARRAAASLDEAPAADVTTVLSQQFSGITRYTLISESGLVLYDSQADAGQMDNHASRPEVSKAARTGEAVSMRYSETLGTDTVYAAEKLSDGRIVRLSETRHSLFAFLGEMLVPTLFALVVVAGLVFLLSRLLTRHIMPWTWQSPWKTIFTGKWCPFFSASMISRRSSRSRTRSLPKRKACAATSPATLATR